MVMAAEGVLEKKSKWHKLDAKTVARVGMADQQEMEYSCPLSSVQLPDEGSSTQNNRLI